MMTNVARHAEATRISIALIESPANFILEVKDNGRGIRDQEISGLNSLGLLGMKERAFLLGGEIQIQGRTGQGTLVRLSIPAG